jgi:hypothetical protein
VSLPSRLKIVFPNLESKTTIPQTTVLRPWRFREIKLSNNVRHDVFLSNLNTLLFFAFFRGKIILGDKIDQRRKS